MKRPAFQFYPADWRKDAALQSCSLAAQGLWVNVMCIAHECQPYGHLSVNGKPMAPAQLARLVGLSAKECTALLAELEGAGVFSRTDDGGIFSRRMVKDEETRRARAEGGCKGGDHGHKGGEYGGLGGRPKGGKKPPLEPPPSASASSSPSGYADAAASGGKPPSKNPIRDEIWSSALPMLQAQFGETPEVRSYLAKLCKDWGELLVLEAVRDAVATPPLDAKSWLVARCQERRAQSGNKSAAVEARNAAAVEQALKEAGHA